MSKNDLDEDQAYLRRKAEVKLLVSASNNSSKEERLFPISDTKTASNIRASRLCGKCK